MSLRGAMRRARKTGCVYGTPEENLDQLADISIYLGTCDEETLVAALLLEQIGWDGYPVERGREQLQLEIAA